MDTTFNPTDSLLAPPPSDFDDAQFGQDRSVSPADTTFTSRSVKSEEPQTPSGSGSPQPDRKPTKKRKSWGQELPTPKTNLPPRKRAKTEDEKEQRRIERVLRNRAAAQSSRERKRQEVEKLEAEKDTIEQQNQFLARRLREVESEKTKLAQQVAQMAAEMSVFRNMVHGELTPRTRSSAASSPTLCADLLPNRQTDAVPNLKEEFPEVDLALLPQKTVDPREPSFASASSSPMPHHATLVSDMTQHPAEVLCDLQCQSETQVSQWCLSTMEDRMALVIATYVQVLFLTMLSTAYSALLQPLLEIFTSLKTGKPLFAEGRQAPISLFPLIHWLISTPSNPLKASRNSSLLTNHFNRSTQPTLRINLLRRLLACSPALAHPLRDATGRALQLMSSGDAIRIVRQSREGNGVDDGLYSLMTMIWAIESIEKDKTLEKDKTSPVERDDPAGNIRRLCITLDALFENTRESIGTKSFHHGDGGPSGRLREVGCLFSGKPL